MGWDFETPSQDDWLGPVPKRAKSTPATQVTWDNPGHSPDVQLNQGICMALCYKWAGMGVRGEDLANFLTDTTKDRAEWARLHSFQRAWNQLWVDPGRHTNYNGFERLLMDVAQKHLSQCGRHDRLTIEKAGTKERPGVDDWKDTFGSMAPADVYLVLLLGDGSRAGGDTGKGAGFPHSGWGHVAAVGYPGSKPLFFDPNAGQHSWGVMNPAVGEWIVTFLKGRYQRAPKTVKVCLAFKCSRRN